MRAARLHAYGPPESLLIEELPSPVPGDGQVLIDVHAAAVNYPDVLIMRNRYQVSAPLPFTPGSELAGVVREVGAGVEGLAVGDRVSGATFVGAFAEQIALPAAVLTPLPKGVDLRDAAAFTVVYSTAYHALRSVAQLARGETLVVLGAAGGVGLAAVILGKLLGARVVAAASTPEKLSVCREHGADAGIDYTREDLKQRIRDLTDGRGTDVVLDPVGGPYAEQALRSTRWRGRFVCVGFASGEIPRIPLNLVLLKGVAVLGFDFAPFVANAPDEARRNTAELMRHFASGKIRPHIGAVYPLSQAAQALADVAERRATGKIVIDVRS